MIVLANKVFNFTQITKTIDGVYNYLNDRELKLPTDVDSIEKLDEIYDKVEELDKKIGKFRGAFRHSVTSVIDQKQNEILATAMMKLSPDELVALSNKLKARNQKLHSVEKEESSFDKPTGDNDL